MKLYFHILLMNSIFYVYILKSFFDNNYYIGQTGNLKYRIWRHNNGLVKSTRYRKPFELIYFEKYDLRSHAMKREKELKKMKGGNEFKKLIDESNMLKDGF